MREKEKHLRPVVILGMSANGLSVARSLGRRKVPIIGIDSFAKAPGLF